MIEKTLPLPATCSLSGRSGGRAPAGRPAHRAAEIKEIQLGNHLCLSHSARRRVTAARRPHLAPVGRRATLIYD